MTRYIAIAVGFGLSYAVAASAQTGQNNATATTAVAPVAAATPADSTDRLKGARFLGKLTTKLDAKHAKAGQPVVVEVKKDVKSGDQVVLKKGSLAKGTVIAVTPYPKGGWAAELDISFDSVDDKAGSKFRRISRSTHSPQS